MTRLILPLLTIVTSLHRLHRIFSFTLPPRTSFGTARTSSSMSLKATRKEADSKKELDEEDSYTPASWEAELHYIVNGKRLEKAWVGRMIRSKPRYLPYKKCSEWACRNRMNNRKEWMEWIAMGEEKPSLVPSDPEVVYRSQGTWVSWNDFLGVTIDPNSMGGAGI